MRNTLLLFASIALTILCWGLYGPVLRSGQEGMSLNSYIVYLLTRATATYQTDPETRAMLGRGRKPHGQKRLAKAG